ncbi:MAG: hypothetical protein RL297_369 [Pseudomonadota bacterium]|jgi:hypothetical protein
MNIHTSTRALAGVVQTFLKQQGEPAMNPSHLDRRSALKGALLLPLGGALGLSACGGGNGGPDEFASASAQAEPAGALAESPAIDEASVLDNPYEALPEDLALEQDITPGFQGQAQPQALSVLEPQAQALAIAGTDLRAVHARRQTLFSLDSGKAFQKRNFFFVRRHVYNDLSFAFRVFWNRETQYYADANNAIMRTLGYFLTKEQDAVFANHDEWYWGYDQICAMMELYSSTGSKNRGLISKKTEDLFYKFAWLQLDYYTKRRWAVSPDLNQYNTWHLYGSENHHFQLVYSLWHSLQLVSKNKNYNQRLLSKDQKPEHFLRLWVNYIAEYLLERGKKGLFVEVGFYNPITLKGIYNIHAFSDSPVLKRRAQSVIDLHWAEWAQEQIAGIRCGPQNRIYLNSALDANSDTLRDMSVDQSLAWLYFNIGKQPQGMNKTVYSIFCSDYVPPAAVTQLALRKRDQNYEIYNRRLGLAQDGAWRPATGYKLRQNNGPARYIYVTPTYILGSWIRLNWKYTDWTMIASQNHWFGATFTTHEAARILFCVNHPKSTYNSFRSIQKKGALVTQMLPAGTHSEVESSPDQPPPSVWVSELGMQLIQPIDEQDKSAFEFRKRGWIFGRAGMDTFFALLVPDAKTRWSQVKETKDANGLLKHRGRFLELEPQGKYSPIFLEIGHRRDWKTFGVDFQPAVLANMPQRHKGFWRYRTLDGQVFELFDDMNAISTIDGKKIDTKRWQGGWPSGWVAMDSPFLKSMLNTGKATITVDGMTHVIDFS